MDLMKILLSNENINREVDKLLEAKVSEIREEDREKFEELEARVKATEEVASDYLLNLLPKGGE